ncbi:hypothetical protein ATE84_1302 [Aquimarina sp. MAR_2010_214]|uniref:hypothetical protein n=1 Tax=Aquimarina sp. MAR_2010_214 TaxID=1250026 RepID=UPI000CB479D4|nr:hypothetical protein [Aquimarina sp. MAR_2010_214]PKV49281.1 hypothetical protein ATE84_1302 [Aquimarina sp. MAR_2010_214]
MKILLHAILAFLFLSCSSKDDNNISTNENTDSYRLKDQNITIILNESKKITLGDIKNSSGNLLIYTVTPDSKITFKSEKNIIEYKSDKVGPETLNVTATDDINTPITAKINITVKETETNSFDLIEGYDFYNPKSDPNLPSVLLPGESYTNPHYKTTVRRISNPTQDGPGVDFMVNEYSRKQSFNSNDTKILIFATDGFWHVYNTDGSHYKKLQGPAGDCEIDWHHTDPNKVIYTGNNGVGLKFFEHNIATDEVKTIIDLTKVTSIKGDTGLNSVKQIWPDAAVAWTKAEGTSSKDGRYRGLMIEKVVGNDFHFLGLMVYDQQENAIVGYLNKADYGDKPDHVSMSPSGDYIVPSSTQNGVGTRAYTKNFSSYVQLHHTSEHSDLGVLPNGHDVYIAADYQDNEGQIFMYDIQANKKTEFNHLYQYTTGGDKPINASNHYSLKAFNKPGWALLSTYSGENPLNGWAQNKIMAIELKQDGRILNISNTYGDHAKFPGKNYWTETKASTNRDFTKIIFTSTWFAGSDNDSNAYIIELEPNQIPNL